jgi:hypothetical protein
MPAAEGPAMKLLISNTLQGEPASDFLWWRFR